MAKSRLGKCNQFQLRSSVVIIIGFASSCRLLSSCPAIRSRSLAMAVVKVGKRSVQPPEKPFCG